MFGIIKFKSVKTLVFITWKEKDHINQGGNTKIKPSYAFQCFSPGVKDKNFKPVWEKAVNYFWKCLCAMWTVTFPSLYM